MLTHSCKRWSIDFIESTQILRSSYNTNGSNWHTFLLLHYLDIRIVKFDEQLWNKVKNLSYFLSHLYVQPFMNLNPLPIVETVILSYLKRAK